MKPGKLASQVSHASVEATLMSDQNKVRKWREEGMKKVVLKVYSKEELFKLKKKADNLGLTNVLITDAGKTFFKGKATVTCLAIGPDEDGKIDLVTGKLKML